MRDSEGSEHVDQSGLYSTAQRKGKRIPRAIRVRSADRVLIVRGSVIVNPRVITSSPRAARGSISAEVHAAIIANAQANIALVRVYVRMRYVWARTLYVN